MFFFFQAEDGIRDDLVTGVQTCALPISDIQSSTLYTRMALDSLIPLLQATTGGRPIQYYTDDIHLPIQEIGGLCLLINELIANAVKHGKGKIGRASCRERVYI